MKLYRSAALALTGWYLLIPRVQPIKDQPAIPMPTPFSVEKYTNEYFKHAVFMPRDDLPLRQWQILQVFDKATDCNYVQNLTTKKGSDDITKHLKGFQAGQALAETEAVCVATDDPRLAK
jgi:hypothetical protein